MPIWINVLTGVLVLLLTTIGGLVLGRLVFMSKQIADNHKEAATAIATIWDDIKEERRRCGELHLAIAKDIGALQERTISLQTALDTLKAETLAKYDRASAFWNTKADAVDRAISSLQGILMGKKK